MKIEKLNDHQIRCTLTKEDLAMRHINLSELAYGTEKTKALFQDMMTQASIDFGFEAEDIPLMIEAIPLSPEKIVLIITKVESPDELDTRFSNFTHWEDMDEDSETDYAEDSMPHTDDMTSELLDLLEQIKKNHSATEKTTSPDTETTVTANQTRLFTFMNMNDAIEAAYMVSGLYHGNSTLYKDTLSSQYQLILHQGQHSASEFNKILHIMSSYLEKKKCTPGVEAYCTEHCKIIIPNHAVQTLAKIQ